MVLDSYHCELLLNVLFLKYRNLNCFFSKTKKCSEKPEVGKLGNIPGSVLDALYDLEQAM